jgi:transmembrane sensor
MTKEQAKALILKYNAGQCTAQEEQLVESWYLQFADDEDAGLSEADLDKLHKEMWLAFPDDLRKSGRSILWPRIAAAASIILVTGIGFWSARSFITDDFHTEKSVQYVNNLPPGKNTAILTGADGKSIALNSAKSALVMTENRLAYNDGSAVASSRPELTHGMQTVTTPKGGTYQVILPDGTKVQLNAASTIRFAVNFNALAERRIELNGQAYFEVSKDKKHPFVVASKNQEVKVLGTHFDVSAYDDDESTKTTLLEGAILINNQVLKPNQQSVQVNGRININTVNASDAVDWKQGEFICRNAPLEDIMKKIARWYDVEVVYASPTLKNITFSGSLSRYDQVVDVLKALSMAGKMKFKLEKRKIQVL